MNGSIKIRHRRAGRVLATVPGSTLAGCEHTGAELAGARMRRANLFGVQLAGADLTDADLRGADLRFADLAGADLHTARLDRADLRGASLVGADIRSACLKKARLTLAVFDASTRWPDGYSPQWFDAWTLNRSAPALIGVGRYALAHGMRVRIETRWDYGDYTLFWRSGLGWNAIQIAFGGSIEVIVRHHRAWRAAPVFGRHAAWLSWAMLPRDSDWATIERYLEDARQYLASRAPT